MFINIEGINHQCKFDLINYIKSYYKDDLFYNISINNDHYDGDAFNILSKQISALTKCETNFISYDGFISEMISLFYSEKDIEISDIKFPDNFVFIYLLESSEKISDDEEEIERLNEDLKLYDKFFKQISCKNKKIINCIRKDNPQIGSESVEFIDKIIFNQLKSGQVEPI